MSKINEIRLSGQTYSIEDSSALHNLDLTVTSGGTNAVAGSGIYSAITAATNALAEAIAEQGYQTSGDVQNAISGKVDTSTYNTFTGATETALDNKANKNEIPSVSGYADSVKYNSTSKYVEFYHGGTGGTVVFSYDASPFLIDGMVQNVEIKDVTISGESVTCLVISFNTDAGKQDINIPLTEIFDPSNYYNKAQIDSTVSGLTARMGEDEEVTAAALNALNEEVSGKVETSTYDTFTGATNTALAGKQATLVSGTNIKTVNNQSLLGSGNIDIQGGNSVEVSGTTLVFL